MAKPKGSRPILMIDARMIAGLPHGIGRYVSRLAQGLALLEGKKPLPYIPVFLRVGETPESVFSGFASVVSSVRFLHPLELGYIPLAVKRAGARAFHSPSFASFPKLRIPWIATVHDLNHLAHAGIAKRAYYESLLKPFAQKAAALVTVSEFSRRELREWLGPCEIEIARNALSPALLETPPAGEAKKVLERLGVERGKFFFCLSNPKPHKNVPALLEGYSALPESRMPLVLGGVSPDRKLPGLRAPLHLTDADCHVLWANCAAFIFPSLYEGFGLPPVEGAAAGAPLVVSAIEPLQEALAPVSTPAGSECLEWVPPEEPESWRNALDYVTRNPLSPPPIEARRALLEAYSVDKLGQTMDRIYRRVLDLPL